MSSFDHNSRVLKFPERKRKEPPSADPNAMLCGAISNKVTGNPAVRAEVTRLLLLGVANNPNLPIYQVASQEGEVVGVLVPWYQWDEAGRGGVGNDDEP